MSEPVLKGSIELRVSEDELSAHLIFTPQQEGKEWNMQALLSLLGEEGITEGFDQYSLREVMNSFADAEEGNPREAKLAEGIPPKEGKPETVQWEESSIPKEVEEEAERVFAAADPPKITKTVTEKVKFTKKVEKKPKLPFMKPKEELVTTTEKRSREVPVKIDPEILATAWVEAGQKIATIKPAEPGEMGKTVRGTPIMPEDPQGPVVYPGRGVEGKRNELAATEKGFLRRGKNWVEVIPFSQHNWELETSKDNATLYFHFMPGHKLSEAPSVEQILERVKELAYPPEAMVSRETIESILEKAIESEEPTKNVSLSQDRDAEIDISVTDDNMKALLNLKKGRGRGSPLLMKQVGASISASGLKGMDLKKIKADLVEFYRSKNQELKDYILVEGKSPGKAKEPAAKLSVSFLTEEEREPLLESLKTEGKDLYPGIHSHNEFPLEMVEDLSRVERHQEIGEIIEGKKGENGKDVYGKVLEGQAPGEAKLSLFENLQIEANKIIANITGLLEVGRTAAPEETQEKTSQEPSSEAPPNEAPSTEASSDKAAASDTTAATREAAKEEEKPQPLLLLRIRPYGDGAVGIELSPDKMEARITITAPKGSGKAVTLEKVRETVAAKGVKEGVDEELLRQLTEKAAEGESVTGITFARGTAPKHASSNKIELLVSTSQNEKVKIREDGTADYKNTSSIVSVTKDQHLAKLLPSETEPTDGVDVTGKALPAKKIQDFQLEIGENIRQEEGESGALDLYSEIDGELFYDRKSIKVQGIHLVEGDVDLKSGNIKFSGTVQVKGSVTNGFYVISTDSVMIKEAVEGALVSAEKDIIVGQGIKGLGKAVLRSKQNIGASFAEQATILSVANIKLKNSCLRCFVKCNGKLILESDKGDLVGGRTRVRRGLSVHNMGSPGGAETHVSFGQDYLVEDQIEKEEKEIEKIKEKLTKFDFFLHTLEKEGKTAELNKGRKEKFKLMKIMEKRGMRVFTLKEKFEEHYPSELEIRGTLYPGVVIESHGRFYNVKEEEKKVTLVFDQKTGQIIKKDPDSSPEEAKGA